MVSRTQHRAPRRALVLSLSLLAAGITAARAAAAPGPQVYLIPSLQPGGDGWSAALGISADGSTVVGSAHSPAAGNNAEAYRWTVAGGTQGLGDLPGSSFNSFATSCSADGSVITGLGSAAGVTAFRWTAATGMTALPAAPGFNNGGIGYGISSDGLTIIGNSGMPAGYVEATRWTPAGPQPLGPMRPGSTYAEARGVSGDGSVIVGTDTSGGDSAAAFRWTEAAGFEALPDIPQGQGATEALGISADGRTVVGFARTGSFLPVRWHDGVAQFIGLDASGGSHFGLARDVTADGSIVVGNMPGGGAFMWDAAHGYRSLNTALLNDYGASTSFWLVGGISDDGLVIAGADAVGRGLVVVLPEPSLAGVLLCAGSLLLRRRRSA